MTNAEPALALTAASAAAVRRGHPWVYRDGLVRPPRLASGTVVALRDERGRFAARGLWDASSPIAVRVFEREPDRPLDEAALFERIMRAFRRRDEMFVANDTTAYRLCNGEGDRVPGFVVDRYGEAAVARIDGEAMRPWLERLAQRLGRELDGRGIRAFALRESKGRGEPPRLVHLAGTELPERTMVREHGMAMEVDLARGQKTGAFLDQR